MSCHMYCIFTGFSTNGWFAISTMISRTLNGRHLNAMPVSLAIPPSRMTARYV